MTFSKTRTGALALALAGALAVAGCGSDDSASTASGGHDGHDMSTMPTVTTPATATKSEAAAAAVDKAFVEQMIPHHEMAVEMAGYAPARGERSEIRELGKAIIAGQAPEITEMKKIAKRLGAKPAEMAKDGMAMDHSTMGTAAQTLGLSMDEMGMSMEMGSLRTAKPFDRAFIDEMIPHHQGAIRMARAELERGSDPALKKVAEAIVEAQIKEIKEMNSWRKAWYGSESPAGGVPAAT